MDRQDGQDYLTPLFILSILFIHVPKKGSYFEGVPSYANQRLPTGT